jgi:hypothetical protein
LDCTWFNIFNLDDFLALGLVSQTLTLELEAIGEVDVLVVQGNYTSIVYDDVQLTIQMNGRNPFVFDGYGVYLDENNDVWLGIVDED